MRKLFFIFIAVTVFASSVFGQPYIFKNTTANISCIPALQAKGHFIKTSDLGYAGVCNSGDSLNHGIYCVKYDRYGTRQWDRVFNSGSFGYDVFIAQAPDGSYFISSSVIENLSDSNNYFSDVALIKLDAFGNFLWAKRYGGTNNNEYARCVITTSAEVIIYGSSSDSTNMLQSISLYRIDFNGNLVGITDYFRSGMYFQSEYAIKCRNNDLICAGEMNDSTGTYAYFFRVSPTGNIIWGRRMNVSDSIIDLTTQYIEETSTNDFILTGRSGYPNYDDFWNILAMKIASNGDLRFTKTFGGNDWDEGMSIHETSTGEYLIFAEPESFAASSQTSVINIDSSGNFQWMYGYGGTSLSYPYAAVGNPEDTTYTIWGTNGAYYTDTSLFLLKILEDGHSACEYHSIVPTIYSFGNWDTLNFIITNHSGQNNAQMNESHFFYPITIECKEGEMSGCSDSLFIPTAFSPNNDGHNDTLFVRCSCIKTLDFKVYDRWGEMVFETVDRNKGWDGNYHGAQMNNAIFVYYLTATYFDGTVRTKKGDVSLIR